MAKHRTHSIDFKRQVAQDYLAGETLHGLAKRHDLSRNLIRIWVRKYEVGALDEDTAAAALLQEYERGLLPSSGWSASRLSNWNF
jgi:transposase-like protein